MNGHGESESRLQSHRTHARLPLLPFPPGEGLAACGCGGLVGLLSNIFPAHSAVNCLPAPDAYPHPKQEKNSACTSGRSLPKVVPRARIELATPGFSDLE